MVVALRALLHRRQNVHRVAWNRARDPDRGRRQPQVQVALRAAREQMNKKKKQL
jgi:hypothetical protein